VYHTLIAAPIAVGSKASAARAGAVPGVAAVHGVLRLQGRREIKVGEEAIVDVQQGGWFFTVPASVRLAGRAVGNVKRRKRAAARGCRGQHGAAAASFFARLKSARLACRPANTNTNTGLR